MKLKKVSVSTSGIAFFNANTGSKVESVDTLSFPCSSGVTITINMLLQSTIEGNFPIEGKIKWMQDERSVFVGSNKTSRRVRDGIIADKTGHVIISIWGDLIDLMQEDVPILITNVVTQHFNGIKLATTADSNISLSPKQFDDIDWDTIKPPTVTEVISSPDIVSVKAAKFLMCVNIDCNRKLSAYPGENAVFCNGCKRKMLLKRCKATFNCEIVLQSCNGKQVALTVFPNVLSHFLGPEILEDTEGLEDRLLMLTDVDFEINNAKKIVTEISHHKPAV